MDAQGNSAVKPPNTLLEAAASHEDQMIGQTTRRGSMDTIMEVVRFRAQDTKHQDRRVVAEVPAEAQPMAVGIGVPKAKVKEGAKARPVLLTNESLVCSDMGLPHPSGHRDPENSQPGAHSVTPIGDEESQLQQAYTSSDYPRTETLPPWMDSVQKMAVNQRGRG